MYTSTSDGCIHGCIRSVNDECIQILTMDVYKVLTMNVYKY